VFLDVAYSLTCRSIRRLLGLADRETLIRELLAENMVLRQRIAVLGRTNPRARLHRRDRVVFAVLSRILPRERWGAFGFSPSTLLRWHRELVGRKWTFKRKRMGRPPIDPELAALIIRIAKDSSDWGCYRIKGELQGLGIRVGVSSIRRILRRAGVPPAPRRDGPSWAEFLRAQADAILACDFFTVETVFLRTLYVVIFIEVGSRRLHFSASTSSPDTLFITQQARNLYIEEEAPKDRGGSPEGTLPDPRPRRQVRPLLRRGVPHRRCTRHQDPHPGPERQRLRRAVDPDDPGRGDRPRTRARAAAS
jgi:transposase